MQPNQNPYDFIMQNPQQKRGGLNLPTGGRNKIILMFAFFAVVAIVLIIGVSLILSVGKANNEDLVDVVAWQTELSRVLDDGLQEAGGQTLKNRLSTLQASVASDKASLEELLASRSVKISKESLASKASDEVDADLEVAKRDGSYDQTLQDIVEDISRSYYQALQTGLEDTASQAEKELLQTAGDNLQITLDEDN